MVIFNFSKTEKIILLIGVIFFILFPFCVKKPFPIHLMITIIMYSIMGLSWNLLGSAGVISLGHVFFFGLGGYISSYLLITFGINPWIGMVIAAIVNFIIAKNLGTLFLRLKGHYFAIATIALAEGAKTIVINWPAIGGSVGLFIPLVQRNYWINFQFPTNKIPYYFIILLIFAITFLYTNYIFKTKFGYYLKAMKGNLEAARSLGINVSKYRVKSTAISAVIMSVSGTFMAQYLLYLTPDTFFPFNISLYALLVAVVGGLGSVWGPVIGSFLLLLVSEGLRIYIGGTGGALDLMVYGAIIMLVAVFQPTGIMGLRIKKKKW